MRPSRWLIAIWFCFLTRAWFYSAALPIWEGYDEWSHFAVVQRMAFRGELLVSRESPVARDVSTSLALAPVAWEIRTLGTSHDDFWKLPEAEIVRREAEFRALPSAWGREDTTGPLKAYQGLHAPLSYWLMAPVLLLSGQAHLATQMLLLRWFNMAILSLIVPLTFLTARAVLRREDVALGCAALLTVTPGLLVGIARVSNESVAVTLFTALLWLSVQDLTRRTAIAIGLVLGLGLLTKAYFLAALPVVGLLLVWRLRNLGAVVVHGLWIGAPALAIAGWWYARNLVITGTLTGMFDATERAHAVAIGPVPWLATGDSILFSHLWLGAWSTLTVRSWMYHLLYLLMALAVVGLVVGAARRGTPQAGSGEGRWPGHGRSLFPIGIMAAYYLVFWAGQLYHAAVVLAVWGIATSLGCYLNAVGSAEMILCVGGLSALAPSRPARHVAPAGVALMAIFDFYTLHIVALPYYTGMTAHRPGGAVAAFHPSMARLAEMAARVTMFKSALLPPAVLAALWVLYAAATLALVGIAFRQSRRA